MKILVIGGTRFFGIHMVHELLQKGHQVTIATRGKSLDVFGDSVERIILERTDADSMRNALADKTFDVVIDKIAYCSNDIKYALDVIHCHKYIYMSTTAVYQPKHINTKEEEFGGAAEELIWCNRSDFPYDKVKRQAECALCQIYNDQNWLAVGVDLFLLALAAAMLFPALCVSQARFAERAGRALSVLFHAPVRVLASAAVLLLWGGLLVGLFPASVPLSLALGFWPPALLCAQLLLPPLSAAFDVKGALDAFEPAPAPVHGLTAGQRTEIWWRRRWPLVLGMVVCVSLFAGVLGTMLDREEPDLQIAVVHADALPDGVLSALENALSEQVGDLNADGTARVTVNDYPVMFDGSAKNSDIQTAGMARLVTDVAAGDSALFVVADTDGFLSVYGDKMDADAARLWADCPILAGLNAGTFSTVEDIYTDVDGQVLLGELTVFPVRSAGDEALALLGPSR